jgi:PadR family transcriptional regulator PadR
LEVDIIQQDRQLRLRILQQTIDPSAFLSVDRVRLWPTGSPPHDNQARGNHQLPNSNYQVSAFWELGIGIWEFGSPQLTHLDNHDEGRYRRQQHAMADTPNTDVIQGTLDMLILKTLSLEPMHGFGIARRVEQVSRGVFKVNPGSLLTALTRLERAGWLDAEWRQTANSRRAKYYTLTRTGRKQLEEETANWARRATAVARILKAEG